MIYVTRVLLLWSEMVNEDLKHFYFLNFKNPIYILNQGVLMLHASHRYKIHSIYIFWKQIGIYKSSRAKSK